MFYSLVSVSSLVLRRVWWLCVTGRKICGFDRCGHWEFHVKCVSEYWNLRHRKKMYWRWQKGFTRGKKVEWFTRLCLVGALVMGAERTDHSHWFANRWAWDWGTGHGWVGGEVKNCSYPPCFPAQSGLCIPRELLLEFEARQSNDFRELKSLLFTGSLCKRGRDAAAGVQLQSWGWDEVTGLVKTEREVKIYCWLVCLPGRNSFLGPQGCVLELGAASLAWSGLQTRTSHHHYMLLLKNNTWLKGL